MPKVLTALAVETSKPRREGGVPILTEISDGGCRGLRLCVFPSGARSWIIRYRYGGRTRKLTLGPAIVLAPGETDPGNGLTLTAARAACTDALHRLKQGFDPGVQKQQRQQQQRASGDTFEAIAHAYFKRATSEQKDFRSAARQQADLERLVFPAWKGRPIAAIRRSDVVRLLDAISEDCGPTMADSVLAVISRIMSENAKREDNFANPIVRGMRRTKQKDRARSRILTDDELRAVWNATSDGDVFNRFIRFLILTACRRSEAARMKWGEIGNGDGTVWVLPASRNKTKVELVRPLSGAAQAALGPRGEPDALVFEQNGRKVHANFAGLKKALDERADVTGWTLHDLRRTARSLMSRARVPDTHAEQCLGHVIPGVKATYDRHKYIAEMKVAYRKLARLIEAITRSTGRQGRPART
jgi:integrase